MRDWVFVRHAETAMAGTFCGRSDPALNERGWEQVRVLVEQMRGRAVEVVYASDLRRAAMTAGAIAEEYGVRAELRAGLREIDFGEWEGLRWEEIEARDGAYAARWVAEFPGLRAPGGEEFAAFEERVLAEVAELGRMAGERRTVIVAHGGVLRTVLMRRGGVKAAEAWERTRGYGCWFAGAEVGL